MATRPTTVIERLRADWFGVDERPFRLSVIAGEPALAARGWRAGTLGRTDAVLLAVTTLVTDIEPCPAQQATAQIPAGVLGFRRRCLRRAATGVAGRQW